MLITLPTNQLSTAQHSSSTLISCSLHQSIHQLLIHSFHVQSDPPSTGAARVGRIIIFAVLSAAPAHHIEHCLHTPRALIRSMDRRLTGPYW
jgi:hypothetical protein